MYSLSLNNGFVPVGTPRTNAVRVAITTGSHCPRIGQDNMQIAGCRRGSAGIWIGTKIWLRWEIPPLPAGAVEGIHILPAAAGPQHVPTLLYFQSPPETSKAPTCRREILERGPDFNSGKSTRRREGILPDQSQPVVLDPVVSSDRPQEVVPEVPWSGRQHTTPH